MQNVNLYWLIPEVLTGLLAVALIWRYADLIVAWLKSKNWSTHTVLAGAAGLAIWVADDPGLQEWIKTTLAAHPQIASLITLALIAVAKSTHSSSQAGTLATARNIEATTSIPTAKIDAADITTK